MYRAPHSKFGANFWHPPIIKNWVNLIFHKEYRTGPQIKVQGILLCIIDSNLNILHLSFKNNDIRRTNKRKGGKRIAYFTIDFTSENSTSYHAT